MPLWFHGPDTRLDGRALYDTDLKLARRRFWLYIGNLGIAFMGECRRWELELHIL